VRARVVFVIVFLTTLSALCGAAACFLAAMPVQ
jgi:hypothetical protein